MEANKRNSPINRAALFRAKTIAFYLLCLFLISGCITETEIVLPAVPPKLVISSFISPELPQVEVLVAKSFALVSPENNARFNPVTDATVWLSDGIDSVLIPYIHSDSLYKTSNYPVFPGKTYWLRVTAPGGFAARATCTVPVKVNQSLSARIDSAGFGQQNPDGTYSLELRWQDLPGEGDLYRAEGLMQLDNSGQPGVTTGRLSLSFIDEPQVRDLGADGRTWQIKSDIINNYRESQRNGTLQFMEAHLYTTDRAYYDYHKSLYSYNLTNSFSDPIKLYSNVKGGLGIFGAYRIYSLHIPVR